MSGNSERCEWESWVLYNIAAQTNNCQKIWGTILIKKEWMTLYLVVKITCSEHIQKSTKDVTKTQSINSQELARRNTIKAHTQEINWKIYKRIKV